MKKNTTYATCKKGSYLEIKTIYVDIIVILRGAGGIDNIYFTFSYVDLMRS